jgi:dihydrolipoamide dehydrogenase
MKYDLVVIGGGPAGYVGAIRAAQLGKKVACVEKERAGGTCLNWGCIPTKSLLRNAELYQTMQKHGASFGFKFEKLTYDWSKIISRSRSVADRLAGGVEFLFKKNGVDYLRGEGRIESPTRIVYRDKDGQEKTIETEKIFVATGAAARDLPDLPANGTTVLNSHDAMIIPEQPKKLIVIGAGAIGIEFAYFFNAFGTEVTVVEMLPAVLPVEDAEISTALEKALTRQGIKILTGTKITKVETGKKSVQVTYEGKQSGTLEGDTVLVAIGVRPIVPQGLELKLDAKGYIAVNDRYETNQPGVYAAGDVIGPPWLAHVAMWEAIQLVDGLFVPNFTPKRVKIFPGCTYCQPQVASVGLTEAAAKQAGLTFKVGKFPFSANGKALALGEHEGFIKLIIGEPYGEILGAHIIGPEATELIVELDLAMTLEATYEELEATIHAHPTLSEAVHEAAGAAFGEAIHI